MERRWPVVQVRETALRISSSGSVREAMILPVGLDGAGMRPFNSPFSTTLSSFA
jgi:hypothetical protein